MAKKHATEVEPMKPGKTAEEHEKNKKAWEDEIKGNPIPMKRPEVQAVKEKTAKKLESQEDYQKRVMGVNHHEINKAKK